MIQVLPQTRGGSRTWKGKGHKQASCRWLGRARSSCIFEAANSTPLSSISLLIFTIWAFADGCEVFKASLNVLNSNTIIILEALSTHEGAG